VTASQTPGPETLAPTIARAQPRDTDALTSAIAEAFLPIAPCRWLLPEESDRARLLPRLLHLDVEDALAHGTVYTTPWRDAAALWLARDLDRPAQPFDHERVAAAVGEQYAERARHYHDLVEAAHPAEPHDYLLILAVRPGQQRSGVGSALLAAHHQRLDLTGRAAYLEASDTGTREVYRRHGYREMDPPGIDLPDPATVLHRMWRAPGWAPSTTQRVRVRDGVPGYGGAHGTVTGIAPTRDRPITLALHDPSGGKPDEKWFTLYEIEPVPPASRDP
jgi:GNAT superfamily N-acetyltransferase